MDIRPPKKPTESFTIVRAKALIVFSRIVGVTAIASQLGVFTLVPEKYQKPVSVGALLIGLVAIWTGNEKQGSVIVQDRLSKRDIFTEPGKPGANKENALYQVFLTAGELTLANAAVTQGLPLRKDSTSPATINVPRVNMHEQVARLASQQAQRVDPAEDPVIPTPKPSLTGVRSGILIHSGRNSRLIPDEVI
jgi:hypothetical protein